MSTTTANMALSVPSVNDADYPASISNSLNKIDLHDHSTGKGVPLGTNSVSTAAIQNEAVTTAKIEDEAVTIAKVAPRGSALSSSCGSAVRHGGAVDWQDIANLTLNITTTGGPVWLGLTSAVVTEFTSIRVENDSLSPVEAYFRFLRDGTSLGIMPISMLTGATGAHEIEIPINCFSTIDFGAAVGAHTYKMQVYVANGSDNSVVFNEVKLKAYELL